MKKIVVLVVTLLIAFNSYAQSRGMKEVAETNLGNRVNIGKQYALFIAIDAYREWTPLKKPVADAKEIRDILRSDYYIDEVIELYNEQATKQNIMKTFTELQSKLGVHDSLFIYYAGHGYLDKNSEQGFWIPVDGGSDTSRQDNWLPNSQIRGYISRFKTIHVFMVSDSCFSGDILNTSRSAAPQIDNDYFRKAYSLTSRQVLTSGASEQVPDQSEFSAAFINSLRKNTEPLIDPLGIFNDVRRSVRSTTPLYGSLAAANHQEGATFIFFRRQTSVAVTPETELFEWEIFEYNGKKSIVITNYTGNAKTIQIPETIQGLPVENIWTYRFQNRKFSNINISSTVTGFGDIPFDNFPELESINVDNRNKEYISIEGVLFSKDKTAIYKYPSGKMDKSYSIPSTVTRFGVAAFSSCFYLTSISIPASLTDMMQDFDTVFPRCNNLTSITVDNRNTVFTSIEGVLYSKDKTIIFRYPAGKQANSYSIQNTVRVINQGAFESCKNLTNITIPTTVINIEAHAFINCSNLTSINIPSTVTDIGISAFDRCDNLTSVTISRKTNAKYAAFPEKAKIIYRD